MRTLFFFIALVLPLLGWSATEILENTSNGATFIDPMNEMARINFSTTFKNANIKPTYECAKYIMVKKKNESGDIVTEKTIAKKTDTCDSFKQSTNNFVSCKEFNAMVMTIDDPKTCGQPEGTCQTVATPVKGSLDIRLSSDQFKNDMKSCSPEHQLLIIKDKTTPRGALSSLKDKSHCGLDKKRVFTGDKLWDSQGSPLTQINTSDKPGFFVGNHTQYFFDYTKNQWCIHFKPELASTAPVCDDKFNNMTRSISFLYPSSDQKVTKGVVKLGMENGKPVAHIGMPKSEEYSPTPSLDDSKPMMKVSLFNDESSKQGRRTVFELKDSMTATSTKKLTVAPTFSIGDKFSSPGNCGKASCLKVPVEVSGDQGSDPLYCKNNDQNLDLTEGAEDLCYSCNGISSGACGNQTTLISKSGNKVRADDTRQFLAFDKALNDLKSCKSSPEIIQEDATTEQ